MKTQIWFTIADLAERWGKSAHSVHRLLDGGKLQGMKIGGSWRIHADAVAEFESPGIPANRQKPAAFRAVPDVLGKRRRAKASA
ncbi:MAG TPA: helix-turn-helix domain-containing protein [Tepidisphaeraceae bacterium]|nr:helix-turn-helix domain-containing protein [Tepidisphaeraceae bacterium]